MSDLRRWLPEPDLDLGRFRFRDGGPPPRHRAVRRVVVPSPDGPRFTGDTLTREGTGAYHRHHDPDLAGRPFHSAGPTPEDV